MELKHHKSVPDPLFDVFWKKFDPKHCYGEATERMMRGVWQITRRVRQRKCGVPKGLSKSGAGF